MRLVFLGPPGIGKGTQARILEERYSAVHLSTGDILRAEIARKTKLGGLAKQLIDEGRLVPDDVMLEMMTRRLQRDDVQDGYILDGFPRTVSQAEGLEKILDYLDQSLDAVIALEGGSNVLVKRLSNRRTCSRCGAITNLVTNPPRVKGKCNRCGGKLVQRDDDKPSVIQERLKVYEQQTELLVDFYLKKSLLIKVDGEGTIDEVAQRMVKKLPPEISKG